MIEIKGIDALIAEITRKKYICETVAVEALEDAANRVRDLAREFVPIDKLNLQDAIVVTEDRRGIGQSTSGFTVSVDLSHEGTRAPTVEQYALRMESGEGWSGVAKAGSPRGAHYFERAVNQVRAELDREIIPKTQEKINDVVAGKGIIGFFKRLFGR